MRCETLNILFIDICKTASTSIRKAFRKNLPNYEYRGIHHSLPNFSAIGFESKDGTFWRGTCNPVTELDLQTYRTFTVVRNPYDRLVSLYLCSYGQKKPSHKFLKARDEGVNFKMPFEDFVKEVRDNKKKWFAAYKGHRHKPQLQWISDKTGKVRVKEIIRFENLDEDFYNLLEKWSIPQFKLKKMNPAESHTKEKREHYRYYYNPESKKIAEEIYKEDLKYFNYEY